jgi:hypothetical protein
MNKVNPIIDALIGILIFLWIVFILWMIIDGKWFGIIGIGIRRIFGKK